MERWKIDRRRYLCEHVRIPELCDLTLEYAYELLGTSHPLKQCHNMPLVWHLVVISPTKFVTAFMSGDLYVWDLDDSCGRRLRTDGLDKHFSDMIEWQGRLVTASESCLRVWDVETCECVSILYHGDVYLVATVDDRLIMFQYPDTLRLLDESVVTSTLMVPDSTNPTLRMFGFPHHKVALCQNAQIRVFEVGPKWIIPLFATPGFWFLTIHINDLLVSYDEKIIRVWSGTTQCAIPCDGFAMCGLHNGRLAVLCSDHVVRLYCTRSGNCLKVLDPLLNFDDQTPEQRYQLLELPDGRLIGHSKSFLVVWDLSTGHYVHWPHDSCQTHLYVSEIVVLGRAIVLTCDDTVYQLQVLK
jgi:WD40 repeat protein